MSTTHNSDLTCTLYIARHGETDLNSKKIFQGRVDTGLNKNGIAQSHELANLLSGKSFHSIYTSKLKRASRTAKIVSDKCNAPIYYSLDLQEKNFGPLTKKPYGTLHRYLETHAEHLNKLSEKEVFTEITGNTETYEEVNNRIMSSLKAIIEKNKGKTVLIITHGQILRFLLWRLKMGKFLKLQNNIVSIKNGAYIKLKSDSKYLFFEKSYNINGLSTTITPENLRQFKCRLSSLEENQLRKTNTSAQKSRMCTLYVARHGETDHNKKRILQGHADIKLNKDGIAQAQELADKLRSVQFDAAYSSDLARSQKTAEIVLAEKKLAITTTKALRERHFGSYESKTYEAYTEELKKELAEFEKMTEKEKYTYNIADTESDKEMDIRILTYLREIAVAHPGENVLIACHGGVLRFLLWKIGIGTYKELHWDNVKIDNVAYLELKSDGVDFFLENTYRIEGLPKWRRFSEKYTTH